VSALFVAGVALVGALVVGPLLDHAITWWIGWRVALPLLLGRVPAAAEVRHARSLCPACGARLAPAGLPARPAAALAWRCRRCHSPVPGWLALVEVVTAALFGLAAAVIGPHLALVPILCLMAGLIAMSAVDIAVMRIPTRFVYLTGAVVSVGFVVVSLVDGTPRRLYGALLGAALYGGMLLVLHLISPRMLGFGDVRLATLVGLALGWCGWEATYPRLGPVQAVLNAGLLAGLIGSVAGVVLLVQRRRDRPFPFGPAVAISGALVALAVI
jgi:leader peptidase (prepilin peptidase) / N-methyltransferase